MKGIYVFSMDNIISKLEYVQNGLSENLKRLDDSFDILSEGYHGSDLDRIFYNPQTIKLTGVIQNYIDVLKAVKTSYIKQEEIISNQLKHINSKI